MLQKCTVFRHMFNEEIDLTTHYRCMNIVMLFNLFRTVNTILLIASFCTMYVGFFGNCDLNLNIIFYAQMLFYLFLSAKPNFLLLQQNKKRTWSLKIHKFYII